MRHMRSLTQWWRFGWRPSWRSFVEDLAILVAWSIPRRVAYWAVIRLAAPFGVGPRDITVDDVLKANQ